MALDTEHAAVAAKTAAHSATNSRRHARSSGRIATPSLPVLAAVTSRPWWLATGAVVGMLLGGSLATSTGFTASASVRLTDVSTDSNRVKQQGQTVERLALSNPVIVSAAAARGTTVDDLLERSSAEWAQDTDFVVVTVEAADAPSAIADANALAESAVAYNRDAVTNRRDALRQEAAKSSRIGVLDSDDAEKSRQARIGDTLAAGEGALAAAAEGLAVTDPAVSASPAGLSRKSGAIAGLLGGLLLAALAAVVAGGRGLRVRSDNELRALLPGQRVGSMGSASVIAGEFVESGRRALAVVAMPRAAEAARAFASDVTEVVEGHGVNVTILDTTLLGPGQPRRDALRKVARVDARQPGEAIVIIVDIEDEAAGLLAGQTSIGAAIVTRKRAPFEAIPHALALFERSEPVVILAN